MNDYLTYELEEENERNFKNLNFQFAQQKEMVELTGQFLRLDFQM